ncbi:hypothetical protein C0992_002674 [Termitomyces sp. T32_za158]|nr:hypothetical protein C0992_002674 [Termitomyces sp. T32_za158]
MPRGHGGKRGGSSAHGCGPAKKKSVAIIEDFNANSSVVEIMTEAPSTTANASTLNHTPSDGPESNLMDLEDSDLELPLVVTSEETSGTKQKLTEMASQPLSLKTSIEYFIICGNMTSKYEDSHKS